MDSTQQTSNDVPNLGTPDQDQQLQSTAGASLNLDNLDPALLPILNWNTQNDAQGLNLDGGVFDFFALSNTNPLVDADWSEFNLDQYQSLENAPAVSGNQDLAQPQNFDFNTNNQSTNGSAFESLVQDANSITSSKAAAGSKSHQPQAAPLQSTASQKGTAQGSSATQPKKRGPKPRIQTSRPQPSFDFDKQPPRPEESSEQVEDDMPENSPADGDSTRPKPRYRKPRNLIAWNLEGLHKTLGIMYIAWMSKPDGKTELRKMACFLGRVLGGSPHAVTQFMQKHAKEYYPNAYSRDAEHAEFPLWNEDWVAEQMAEHFVPNNKKRKSEDGPTNDTPEDDDDSEFVPNAGMHSRSNSLKVQKKRRTSSSATLRNSASINQGTNNAATNGRAAANRATNMVKSQLANEQYLNDFEDSSYDNGLQTSASSFNSSDTMMGNNYSAQVPRPSSGFRPNQNGQNGLLNANNMFAQNGMVGNGQTFQRQNMNSQAGLSHQNFNGTNFGMSNADQQQAGRNFIAQSAGLNLLNPPRKPTPAPGSLMDQNARINLLVRAFGREALQKMNGQQMAQAERTLQFLMAQPGNGQGAPLNTQMMLLNALGNNQNNVQPSQAGHAGLNQGVGNYPSPLITASESDGNQAGRKLSADSMLAGQNNGIVEPSSLTVAPKDSIRADTPAPMVSSQTLQGDMLTLEDDVLRQGFGVPNAGIENFLQPIEQIIGQDGFNLPSLFPDAGEYGQTFDFEDY